MPFRGFSCPMADFCGFFIPVSWDVLILFCHVTPVDKSVRRPNRRINGQAIGDSAFQPIQFGEQCIQIGLCRSIEILDVEEVGIGDDRRPAASERAPRDEPSPVRSSHGPLSAPERLSGPADLPAPVAAARIPIGASSVKPQWFSKPVSAKDGGGRSLSPSGRSLGQSSFGSASSSTRPPSRTQRSRSTSASAGCASGCAISSSRPCSSDAASVVPIGIDSVARLQRLAPWILRPPGRIPPGTAMAGSCRSISTGFWPSARGAKCPLRSRGINASAAAPQTRSATKPIKMTRCRVRRIDLLLAVVDRPRRRPAPRRARPTARSAPLRSLAACVCGGEFSSRDRLITDPRSTRRKANASPVSPIRMR